MEEAAEAVRANEFAECRTGIHERENRRERAEPCAAQSKKRHTVAFAQERLEQHQQHAESAENQFGHYAENVFGWGRHLTASKPFERTSKRAGARVRPCRSRSRRCRLVSPRALPLGEDGLAGGGKAPRAEGRANPHPEDEQGHPRQAPSVARPR